MNENSDQTRPKQTVRSGLSTVCSSVMRAASLALLGAAFALSAPGLSYAQTSCTPSGTNPDTGAAYDQCIAFTFTGSEQTFTVPNDVADDDIQIKVWGASGASGFFGTRGGHGAFGQGMINATDNDAYTIIVGQGGVYTQSGAKTEGFGGGGLSGIAASSFLAGNGGGFSGVRLNSDYFILMAGGGGASVSAVADGGSGGIVTGFDGGTTISNTTIPTLPTIPGACAVGAGKGGTQTEGGAAGATTLTDNATDGSAFTGGRGGQSQAGQNGGGDSGGGGGGLFGGGGGIGTFECDDNAGGGGSSFLAAGLTNVSTEAQAVRLVDNGPRTDGPGSGDPHYTAISGLTPGLSPDPASNGAPFPLATGAPGNNGLVIIQWTEAAPDPRNNLTPFVCTGDFFQIHDNPSAVSRVDLATGQFETLGNTGQSLRATGFDTDTRLAYSIQQNTNILFAVGANA
ncbi:MAG: glycine rich domain-containing protein, partial [Hyphomonadaceae bacterium]